MEFLSPLEDGFETCDIESGGLETTSPRLRLPRKVEKRLLTRLSALLDLQAANLLDGEDWCSGFASAPVAEIGDALLGCAWFATEVIGEPRDVARGRRKCSEGTPLVGLAGSGEREAHAAS